MGLARDGLVRFHIDKRSARSQIIHLEGLAIGCGASVLGALRGARDVSAFGIT